MGTKEVEARIDEVTSRIWDHNKCSRGGSVDRDFFRAFVADVYETAVLDTIVILETAPSGKDGIAAIEGITGYTMQGK